MITCSELDPLRDEAVDYALRLMWSGVATELHVFPGTCHGFDSLLPEWELSQQLFALQGAALRRALHGAQAAACASVRRVQLACDGGVVLVDVGRVDDAEEAVRQGSVAVGLDRHGPREQRDALTRLGEVVLAR